MTKADLTIIGIDPGIHRCGVAVIHGKEPKLLFATTIETSPKEADPQRLEYLYGRVSAICKKYRPQEAAIEALWFGRNTTTAFRVGQARGVILLALQQAGISPPMEYSPLEVKQTVGASGAASKSQVAAGACRMLNIARLEGPDDTADAVAVALCHLNRRSFSRAILLATSGA